MFSTATNRLVVCAIVVSVFPNQAMAEVTKYARYRVGDKVAYGIVEGERVLELEGEFAQWKPTGRTHALDEVELLVPSEPRHVLALAGNYNSHISEGVRTIKLTTTSEVIYDPETGEFDTVSKTEKMIKIPGTVPEKFRKPQVFFKSPSCLTAHNTNIVLPRSSSGDVHFEAEMVLVIGREAKDVPRESALDHVLGVTCGNDVTERTWQKEDVQWWRGKASDTFGPCGPFIVSGIDYDNLRLRLRLNGMVKQDEPTSRMIHDVPRIVSTISHHITLLPGDLIFTGTPQDTSEIKAGDEVEVELEGVGVLRNRVVSEKE